MAAKKYTLFQPSAADTYHVRFRDHRGKRQTIATSDQENLAHRFAGKLLQLVDARKHDLHPDDATQRWLDSQPDKIRRRFEQIGLISGVDASADEPLKNHIDGTEGRPGWRQSKLALGNNLAGVNAVCNRVKKALDACGFVFWSQIAAPDAALTIEMWLGKRREAGEINGTGHNYTRRDLQSFCQWLFDQGRAPAVALQKLRRVDNAEIDARKYRSLSVDELAELLKNCEQDTQTRQHLSGADRGLLYRFGFESGIRAGQIRALTVNQFQLDRQPYTVTSAAGTVKRRRQHVQNIRPELASVLREHFKGKLPAATAIPTPRSRHGMAHLLRGDMQRARAAWIAAGESAKERDRRASSTFLAVVNENGETAVFHSVRHSHGTALAEAGVPMATIAHSMHHSNTKTTERYVHPSAESLRNAIGKLPVMPDRQKVKATGTHGKIDESLRNPCANENILMDFGGLKAGLANGSEAGIIIENQRFSSENQPVLQIAGRGEMADATDLKSVG